MAYAAPLTIHDAYPALTREQHDALIAYAADCERKAESLLARKGLYATSAVRHEADQWQHIAAHARHAAQFDSPDDTFALLEQLAADPDAPAAFEAWGVA